MLKLTIPAQELWDEKKERFYNIKETTIQLEHSLLSISKWEQIHKKPYLENKDLTFEESLDYIRCMTITPNVDPDIYNYITYANFKEINEYINAPMTATWFNRKKKEGTVRKKEIITNEIIYYWMISFNIPFECQKWHINHLLTLIEVCGAKQEKPEKMNKSQLRQHNKSLNAYNRNRFHSRG